MKILKSILAIAFLLAVVGAVVAFFIGVVVEGKYA